MFPEDRVDRSVAGGLAVFVMFLLLLLFIVLAFRGCSQECWASENLIASWYSISSLKQEGTYKYSKGVMANGEIFDENNYTAAVYGYAFGARLKITNLKNSLSVEVKVTDRIGKRFAKTRIDLTPVAFSRIGKLEDGVISVKVEKL